MNNTFDWQAKRYEALHAQCMAKDVEIAELKRYEASHKNEIREHGTDNCPFCQQDAQLAAVTKEINKLNSDKQELFELIDKLREVLANIGWTVDCYKGGKLCGP